MKNFYGTVTVENIEKVQQMIFDILKNKTYTFVAVNELFRLENSVEVRTDQELRDTELKPVYYGDDKEYAGFNFGDTYGVWGLSTSTRHGDNTYGTFENPYIVIEWDTIKITHQAPAGHLLHWQIKLQNS